MVVLVGRFKGGDYSRELGIDWRILLKWVVREYAVNVCIECRESEC
jgi:hypothetical protein